LTIPGDLDRQRDPVLAALASLPRHDLPRRAGEAQRARCQVALAARAARGARTATWQRLCGQVLEPAAVVVLGAAVLVATLIRAATILFPGGT